LTRRDNPDQTLLMQFIPRLSEKCSVVLLMQRASALTFEVVVRDRINNEWS
jgi:hypothetical protein